MNKIEQQKGFTLVELAIVLTIIGLLIGGILKGQQLMTNSRVTATLAQVKAIEAATTTFRDSYGSMPGDLVGHEAKIPGCGASLTCNLGANPNLGDGIVGNARSDVATFQSISLAINALPAIGAFTQGTTQGANAETMFFWFDLGQAGLITGVNADGINNIQASFGGSHPAARIGGGFTVAYSNGTDSTSVGRTTAPFTAPGTVTMNMIGTTLILQQSLATLTATSGSQPLTPTIAAQMDRKIDDGNPMSGTVQPYGVQASCFTNAGAGPYAYKENVSAKDCGLYFQIQG